MARSENANLQPFDVIEISTPKPPKSPKKHSTTATIIHIVLSLLVEWTSLAWIICVVFYGIMPWLPGPVNAWHHQSAFNCVLTFGILNYVFIRPRLTAAIWNNCQIWRVRPGARTFINYLGYFQQIAALAFFIFGVAMVCVDDPIVRTCTRKGFPLHFKLKSVKNSVRGIVKVKTPSGYGIWDMVHYPLRSNPDIYTLKVPGCRPQDEKSFYHNVTWPLMSTVREVTYDLTPNDEAIGSLVGYCGAGRQLCLNGTVMLDPLRLEWTYTDPQTSESEHKVLESEGQWRFNKHRPYLELRRDDGLRDLVFSAPASKVVCGGGDGDLRTAVVPVGLIMMAEQQYNKRY
jgi:hypothetical protein